MSRGNGGIIGVLNTSKSGVWGLSDVAVARNKIRLAWAYGTGGTVTTSDDYRIHTFTSTGTFECTMAGEVEYLVVAGGGGGGRTRGGGGGAGELMNGTHSISLGNYTITIGAGGPGVVANVADGTNGSNSLFSDLSALGGGVGARALSDATGVAGDGGSGGGGGGAENNNGGASIATGYGNSGGSGDGTNAAGGGGAGGAGSSAGSGSHGGVGKEVSISGEALYYAGGGGGWRSSGTSSSGGLGGGAGGAIGDNSGGNASINTGGGGGGGGGGSASSRNGGNGGSGIVIIRYKVA